MSLLATLILAFSMSADAFAASLGKGAALDRPPFGEALRCGLIFGAVEGVTPLIGWVGGAAVGARLAGVDRWVACAILAFLGGMMLRNSLRRPAERERPRRHSTRVLLVTAIGTSIDAMAVGASLALIDASITAAAIAIGAATFVMTTCGILLGRVLGEKSGRVVEALGGGALILIGLNILTGSAALG